MDSSASQPTPWLVGDPPRKRLDHDRLSERILNLLGSQNMCVLATAGANGPLATPVRYYCRDFDVIFTASPTSPKLRNIRSDNRVSLGIFAPHVGLASSRGCQVFGNATVALPGTPEFEDAIRWYRWQSDSAERGRSTPPSTAVVTVKPERIVYTEHWLRRDGYAPRQVWTRAPKRGRG
jgi:general stress protein 26